MLSHARLQLARFDVRQARTALASDKVRLLALIEGSADSLDDFSRWTREMVAHKLAEASERASPASAARQGAAGKWVDDWLRRSRQTTVESAATRSGTWVDTAALTNAAGSGRSRSSRSASFLLGRSRLPTTEAAAVVGAAAAPLWASPVGAALAAPPPAASALVLTDAWALDEGGMSERRACASPSAARTPGE
jgi:hypothetical protein